MSCWNMKLLLLLALIKHATVHRGYVKDVYLNKKFQCPTSVKEIFTVNSEITCSHRCLRKSCTLGNYNTRKGEVGNCEVFTKVGGCSDFSHRYNWKTLAFNVQAIEVIQKVELDITITSYGKSDPGFTYNHVPITVNGIDAGSGRRGFNVAVISPITGSTLGIGNFDTHGSASANAALMSFIDQYPNGSIVCIATTDSANARLTQEAKIFLASLGSVGIATIQVRSTLAMLTAKGVVKPIWFQEKYALQGKGPSRIEASLRLSSLQTDQCC